MQTVKQFQQIKYLQKDILLLHHKIKEKFREAASSKERTEAEQILFDNFYLLDRVAKEVLAAPKNALILLEEDHSSSMGNLILEHCAGGKIPALKSFREFLSLEQKEREIPIGEFDLIPVLFLSSALQKLTNMLFSNASAEEIIPLLGLLNCADLIPIEEIISASCPIDRLYQAEPSGIYKNSSEDTRRKFRSMTEKIAQKLQRSELSVAKEMLRQAQKGTERSLPLPEQHIGYYLKQKYDRLFPKISMRGYLWLILGIPAAMSVLIGLKFSSFPFVILSRFPCFLIVKFIIDRILSRKFPPTPLPAMEHHGVIPEKSKTLAVLSVLSDGPGGFQALKEHLKALVQGNPDENLNFCVLCDFPPSSMPVLPEDKVLTSGFAKMIDELNASYGQKFTGILRDRVYSESEKKFTGFDRKRGAIEQLVCLLHGEKQAGVHLFGSAAVLKNVTYLLALDADTKPSMDSVAKLVAIADHPLNRPVISGNKVIKGYGIITPKISTDPESSFHSPFTLFFGGISASGIYDSVCGEFYQDVFSQSVFAGKGLIHSDSFYALCCHRFEPETVLSHDILEGGILKTGFAGNVEFKDSFPQKSGSYFSRMHRWIRGDAQNLPFLGKTIPTRLGEKATPFNQITRFQLADNLRRAIEPTALFSILFFAGFFVKPLSVGLLLFTLTALLFPYLYGAVSFLWRQGGFSLRRKYFSGALTKPKELLAQTAFTFFFFPLSAYVSIDALIRGLYRRYISHNKLLEWTTAAQSDRGGKAYKSTAFAFLITLALGIVTPHSSVRLIAFLLLLFPAVLYFSNLPLKQLQSKISPQKERSLSKDIAAMWQFYEDFATEENHWLPPDNVQFAPVKAVCQRTSPTNIGMYLLSLLAARDMDLIDSFGLQKRAERTLQSIEALEKYNGNLYNWYDTDTLRLSPNPFVSSVDSGNFLCCLIAFREGLTEYQEEAPGIPELIPRISELIEHTDLRCFYQPEKELFSIGIDPKSGALSPHYYDLLMSEARMLSYAAIAKRIVPKKHWNKLGRTMKRFGVYTGCVAYSGTMFEYFMPELLLKSAYGSLASESLQYCVVCQKQRGKTMHLPFGVSESGYFAFDGNLNYQYKAHGVQKCGLRNGLDEEYVVSPYSSYLAMAKDFSGAEENLKRLKSFGAYGYYGFYEAVDFSQNPKGAVVKSYMAHHVGMSIAAAVNCLKDGIFRERFLRDPQMNSAKELLSENSFPSAFMAENLGGDGKPPQGFEPSASEVFDRFSLEQPRCKLLSNGEYSVAVTDSGASISLYEGKELFCRTTDLTRTPAGCFFAVSVKGKTSSITLLPEYETTPERSTEFSDGAVSFYCNFDSLHTGMRITLPESLPGEIREFAMKNMGSSEAEIQLLCYFEPSLMSHRDYSSHPAFMKLFLSLEYREKDKLVIASRKDRHSDSVQYLAIGFTESVDFEYTFDREEVLSSPLGVTSAFWESEASGNSSSHIPEPCVFLKIPMRLAPKEQRGLHLFAVTAFSEEELLRHAAEMRQTPGTIKTQTLLRENSIEGRIASLLLPKLLFPCRDCRENDEARSKNRLPLSALWKFGISGDLPIVISELSGGVQEERILGQIKCHKGLRLSGISMDLVFFLRKDCADGKSTVLSLLQSIGWTDCIGKNGGVHFVSEEVANEAERTLLFAVAAHLLPKNGVRIETPGRELLPMKISPVSPISAKNTWQKGEESVVIHGKDGTPWCHVLANPVFGTLLSHRSLGFTYAVHSRENKLTPWQNDPMTDNRGEMLLLKTENTLYDLACGTSCTFTPESGIYEGETDSFVSHVKTEISEKGFCKKITAKIKAKKDEKITLAFYTEPVLGVDRKHAPWLLAEKAKGGLLFRNPLNEAVSGFMGILSDLECSASTDRLKILSGDFSKESVGNEHQSCGCLFREWELKKGQKIEMTFYLVFGATRQAVLKMPELFTPLAPVSSMKISTPDKNLDFLWNTWLFPQAIRGRLYARTGFYQNSGAFGFRDQLQDSCLALLSRPKLTRTQILRACLSQFPEGDVLHWWHQFPNGEIKGVRTRYSDDLLWLPYTVCEYTEKTGDISLLSEKLPFCEGKPLSEHEQEKYLVVSRSRQKESVYEHCKRAISHALKRGRHGLLLMGCGDWNDGYNGVGVKGLGESVWLTEFMVLLLKRFAKISDLLGEHAAGESYRAIAAELANSVEANAWDGQWYLRAFYDSGAPMGSHQNEECKIDSLPQSFAVLAELPSKQKSALALESACRWLIDWKLGIIRLFTPPFSGKDRTAGYVTSYPEGVRENGGQYTHGAIWLAIALLQSGQERLGYQCLEMMNPMSRYLDENALTPYKNEPYFLSADIYENPLCPGRGGWSIYTGAAAWYSRAVFEWLLGIKIGKVLTITPSIPPKWNGFQAEFLYRGTKIKIEVSRTGEASMKDNGIPAEYIPFDGKEHFAHVTI